MSTSSTDGTVKLWDILNDGGANPKMIHSKDMGQNELFSMQFCEDIPWVLACGGSKGELAIWDVSENKVVEDHFKGYLISGSYNEKDYNINDANVAHDNQYESMEDEDEDEEMEKKAKKFKKDKKDKKEKKDKKSKKSMDD